MEEDQKRSGDSYIPLLVESAVRERYSAASQAAEPALCCAVEYDPSLLEVLPEEILERDYGCGDPSRHVAPGETVLDLGSGGGKICYIASQIVGPTGAVIGVDMNDDMLALARRYQQAIGERIGWHNTRFVKGRIQDLALDLAKFEAWLAEHPVSSLAGWAAAEAEAERLRQTSPLVASGTVDVVISNCVLNLVDPRARRQMFEEIFRVLRPGGRAVISDITSNQPVPERLKQDAELWSGCISGAFEENAFAAAFRAAGFENLEVLARDAEPWTVVEGIEFRSLTLRAWKPAGGNACDSQQASELPITSLPVAGCCGGN